MQHVSKFKKLTAKTLIAAVDFGKSKHSGCSSRLQAAIDQSCF